MSKRPSQPRMRYSHCSSMSNSAVSGRPMTHCFSFLSPMALSATDGECEPGPKGTGEGGAGEERRCGRRREINGGGGTSAEPRKTKARAAEVFRPSARPAFPPATSACLPCDREDAVDAPGSVPTERNMTQISAAAERGTRDGVCATRGRTGPYQTTTPSASLIRCFSSSRCKKKAERRRQEQDPACEEPARRRATAESHAPCRTSGLWGCISSTTSPPRHIMT